MTNSTSNAVGSTSWDHLAPQLHTVPEDSIFDFLTSAPGGTLVQVGHEVYRRGEWSLDWQNLDCLVDGFSNSTTYDDVASTELQRTAQAFGGVTVLRLGA